MITEVDAGNGKPSLTTQQRIEGLLRRSPSGPDFGQATIGYVEDSIEVATAKFGEVLLKKFPNAYIPISAKLGEISSTYRDLPRTSFVIEGDRKLLQYPNDNTYPLNRLCMAIYLAGPELGVFEYVGALYPTKNPRYAHHRFPWFNNRLSRIAEVGELSLDDPRIKYIAVGYVTQAGKAFATTRAQELLEKAQPFAGVDSAERAITYLDRVGEMVGRLKIDQRFIARGLATMDTIAEGAGLDEQQTRLLLDLAFTRNRAFDQPVEFKQALEPLIRLVAVGNWEEAFQHRDFLLAYFLTSFPAWRGREYRATGELAFDSFKDLAKAVVQHRLTIHDEDVPSEYKKSFGDIFPKKIERAQRERDEAIVRRSLGLSNAIVKELAFSTANMLGGHMVKEMFGGRAEEVKAIITDSTKSISAKYNRFRGFIMDFNPELKKGNIENMFDSLNRKLNIPPVTSLQAPYTLCIPIARPVLGVEMMDDKQACWYKTEHTVDVRLKGGGIEVMMKNWINFGRVLHNVILLACQEPAGKAVLNLDEVRMALQRAYKNEKERDPIVARFTLSDYLMAMLNSVTFNLRLTDIDPAVRFVKELESQEYRTKS